jgi:hypothetical protein
MIFKEYFLFLMIVQKKATVYKTRWVGKFLAFVLKICPQISEGEANKGRFKAVCPSHPSAATELL